MGKKKKNKKIDTAAEPEGFTHNPFAAALGLDPPAPAADEGSDGAPAEDDGAYELAGVKKLIARKTRSGRGGKTVTLVEGLDGWSETQREGLMKDLKRSLGCGASMEDGVIAVQGDQRDRLAGWLTERGVKKVVRS